MPAGLNINEELGRGSLTNEYIVIKHLLTFLESFKCFVEMMHLNKIGFFFCYVISCVVYAELGLDFHQILQRQLLRVKGRIASHWVVMLPPIRSSSDKRNSTLI